MAHHKHDKDDKHQRPNIFQLGNIFFMRNNQPRGPQQQKKANVVNRARLEQEEEQVDQILANSAHNPHVPDAETALEPEIKFEELDLSEENEEAKILRLYRDRNMGAKDFDDFARGIQTWLSMMELESIRRFNELHLDPILEACEDYIMRAAESLLDLIDKALLLCRLRIAKKAAREVARLALERIEKLLEELDHIIPSELLFTWQLFEPELAPEAA
ncbi:MAG: hypothetical protein K1X83_14540 [Oligoflexia bacterium]|nr:hypothetical protein [Oligoflexia bacterium]